MRQFVRELGRRSENKNKARRWTTKRVTQLENMADIEDDEPPTNMDEGAAAVGTGAGSGKRVEVKKWNAVG